MEERLAKAKSKRVDLQGLRGVAVLLVLAMHLEPNSYHFGFVGVDIFFVLSGYLMSKTLQQETIKLASVLAFYGRRFKRIVPLYMVAVTFTYIYFALADGCFHIIRYDREQLVNDLLWVCTFTSNLQPIFQKLGYFDQLSKYRFFVHTWSLGVELQYYIIVPAIMKIASCCTSSIRLMLFLFLAIFSIVFQLYTPSNISYGFLLSRIWQFMCGAMVYDSTKLASSADDKYDLIPNQDSEEEQDTRKREDVSNDMPHAENENLARIVDHGRGFDKLLTSE